MTAFLLGASLIVRAQSAPTQLADVAKALECLDHRESMSRWKRETIEPFKGATDILIYKYVTGGRGVMLRIMYYPSEAAASKSFNSFGEEFASKRNLTKIQNLGDEAFSWGFEDSIVMRKGNLNVYVSAGTDVGLLLTEIEEAEASALSRTERLLLTKNFARLMDKTLSNLSEACRRPFLYRS